MFKYSKLNEKEIIITQFNSDECNVVIPEYIDSYKVRAIGSEAFSEYGENIEKVTLPAGIRRIEKEAFKYCINLRELNLNEGLEYIGEDFIFLTSIEEIFIPSSVRDICAESNLKGIRWNIDENNKVYFTDGCALYKRVDNETVLICMLDNIQDSSYKVMDGCTLIEDDAFTGIDALKEIYLPSSLKTIKASAINRSFTWDKKMLGIAKIIAAQDSEYLMSDDTALYQKTKDGLSLIFCFALPEEYRIDDKVTRILEGAFCDERLSSVTFPANIRYVDKNAFSHCDNMKKLIFEKDEVRLYIPQVPVYRKEEICRLFSNEEADHIYDYSAYDRVWESYKNIKDRVMMALCRLHYAIELSEINKERYRSFLEDEFEAIIADVASREDTDEMRELISGSCFDNNNIDIALEIINSAHVGKLSAMLMEYRNEKLGFNIEEFDI